MHSSQDDEGRTEGSTYIGQFFITKFSRHFEPDPEAIISIIIESINRL